MQRTRIVRTCALAAVTTLAAAVVATPGLAAATTARVDPAAPTTAPAPRTSPTQTPCALRDVNPTPVAVPTQDYAHKPGRPTIGGDRLAGNGLVVPPGSPPLPGNLAAGSWLVADLDTGEVLGACGAHRMLAPASIQKLLLVAAVMPELNAADTTVVTPEDMDFEPGSSAVGLIVGGTYTVEQLFLGLLLNSGNDAANVLARLGGGDLTGGVAAMNAEAERLGAFDTHAETPSGLDGPGQVTSAYDMALIFRACMELEDFRRYTLTPTAQMPRVPPQDPAGFQIQNANRLIYEYPGALGGKTGFTNIARHTYVGAAERDGRRLVVTILGAEIMPVRAWLQAVGLLDWGFATRPGTSVGHLVEPGEAGEIISAWREPLSSTKVGPAAAARTNPWVGVYVAVGLAITIMVGVRLSRGRRPAAHGDGRGRRRDSGRSMR